MARSIVGMPGVRLIIQFTADSAETAEQAVSETAERCKRVQQEPGCLQYEVFRSAMQPEKYVLLEHWDSQESLDVHFKAMASSPPRSRAGITRVREDYEYQQTSSAPAGTR